MSIGCVELTIAITALVNIMQFCWSTELEEDKKNIKIKVHFIEFIDV